jgi:hypothetical protein
VQILRLGNRLTPQQFGERFSMLQQVTDARGFKQQAALVRSLRLYPLPLSLLPDTVQAKAAVLKQQLQQQLGIDQKQTQQLISKQPKVLEYRADFLVCKATEQGQLLELEAADVVVRLWTRYPSLIRASTQLLHSKMSQLQLLLQPYMSPADVRQLVLSQPLIVASHSPEAVRVRLEVLQNCLHNWTPQQLGAELLIHPTVLQRSPETIRYKWRIASQYRDMYMLGPQRLQEQQQQQQQQQQPSQASVLSLFRWPAERYALLEYIMMLQQQQQLPLSIGSSVSNSSQVSKSSNSGGAHSGHVPPMKKVLWTEKLHFERLLQEHYPGFRQWNKQRQQALKRQGQQPE